ncbi:MAG: hemerythrin domain-containing protein [Anaerohalosphaeraceae bacterium]|nr:hemerythrin domain-containing protein [Anaerohalosphaeraceae bacterium]
MEKSKQLADILERIRGGEDPEKVRHEAQLLLKNINLRDITGAQKYLLDSCVSVSQVRTLVYAFASLLGDQFALLRASVAPNHPIRKILAEHDMFETFLADLVDVNEEIMSGKPITEFCSEYRKLVHITGHLQAIDLHNQREEHLLFVALEGYPCHSICRILQRAHLRIKNLVKSLNSTVVNFNRLERGQFLAQLNATAAVLVPVLREHIFQEDNILLPAALEVLKDEKIWKRMKTLDDEMDYCAFDAQPCCG